MKYSNTTLRELSAQYGRILRKCALFNAAILVGVCLAGPAMAATGIYTNPDWETIIIDGEDAKGEEAWDNTVVLVAGQTVTIGENSQFTNNKGGVGGAIAVTTDKDSVVSVGSGTVFKNNTSLYDGGAIGNYGGAIIADGVKFDSNHAQTNAANDSKQIGGGAMSLGSVSQTSITNSIFTKNDSGFNGGAIGTRHTEGGSNNNSAGTLTISGSEFIGNEANGYTKDDTLFGGNGGAISNTFYTKSEVSDSTFTSNFAANNGGAIHNNGEADVTGNGGNMTLTNNTFTSNTAVNQGGAVFNNGTISFAGTTVFDNNTATVGGAISHVDAVGDLTIGDGTQFTNNMADNQAGAVHIQRSNAVLGNNVYFEGNSSGNGGEAHSGGALYVDSDAAKAIKTTVGTGAQFIENTSSKSAGAIYNYQANEEGSSTIEVGANALFDRNTAAANGDAIANYGGTMTLAGAEFKGNTAGALGGAIYNDKDMTLDGTFSFSGNTDSTGANDIHNVGSLTLGGDITLDGGITGDGDITFKDGTTLKLQNAWDGSAPKITAGMVQNDGATLNVDLTIANGTEDATYAFVDAETWNGDALGLSDSMTNNTLYDITAEDGSIRVVKKAAEEAAATLAEAGMTGNQTNAVLAMTEAGSTGNDQADALLNKITSAAQTGDTETAGSLVNELQPLDVPMVQAVATNNAVLSAVTTRLANIGSAGAAVGRSGGDGRVSKLSPWVEGLYSKTHNSQGAGFDAYSQGFAFGADTDLNEDWTVGIGYAYTATDIKNAVRKTNVYGDNYFAYAQYKPSNWYVNAVLNYGHANYKEQGMMNHKYNVDTYGAQVLTGYEWNILNNYAGVRYTYIDTEKYNNGVTETDTKHAQVATAVIGTKVSKDFTVGKNVVFKPEFRLAGTYDFKSDNSTANVSIVGTPVTYSVNAKRLSRAAVETGVGLTATVRNLELSLNYDASFRSENNTQAGMFKIKYNF